MALVPPGDPWIVEFYRNHPQHRIYVNIGTVPVVTGATIHQVDLDLDVVLTNEGDVAVRDEDEFNEHKERLAYPDEITDLALTGTAEAQARLVDRLPPFDGVADRWLDGLDPSTLA